MFLNRNNKAQLKLEISSGVHVCVCKILKLRIIKIRAIQYRRCNYKRKMFIIICI